MRDRPFLTAGESPRPYNEIKRERGDMDQHQRTLEDIAELEAEASAARENGDVDTALAKLLEAENLRAALYHTPRR